MLEAARDARDMAARTNLEELRINRMLQPALVKSIEIIGEAARQVSAPARLPRLRDSFDMSPE